MHNLKIPVWLIAICAFVLMGILLEQLYISKRPVELWGVKLNQPVALPGKVFQSGTKSVGYLDTGWTLAAEFAPIGSQGNKNTRTFRTFIPFDEKFERVPNVSISMSSIDATQGGAGKTINIRADIKVIDKNESGFMVLISTWDGSKLWGLGISWLAYLPEIN